MDKVLMLATTAAMIEQFNMENILLLREMGYRVDVAGNFREGNPITDNRLERFRNKIEDMGGGCYDIPAVRNPIAWRQNASAYKLVVRIIKENEYQFIHCHTPIGSVIGRIAAHRTKIPIIYTAHGFHFFKGAPIKNWILYYPVEKILARWTEALILINDEDYNRAKIRMHPKKIFYIPGIGVDIKKFEKKVSNTEKNIFKQTYGIPNDAKILLSVGELISRKNHRFMIEALARLNCPDIYYLICGKGPLKNELVELVNDLGLQSKVKFLGFVDDISQIYPMIDVFVFPSKQEGLSVALMEAMAAGCPCLASRIRGNTDLLDDEELFSLTDNEELIEKLIKIFEDRNLLVNMSKRNRNKIQKYDAKIIKEKMRNIYQNVHS